ncbi:NmrA-domain-containing protein [Hyaloscypha variabilis F]|uniref:NmrA-domain-containing protein n=1 Tax=Hyaloscypha variabilis (strain UAMH 11265 / GT02V1 / F) TaxID=1149755 RepID=A0A2J6RH08_HYAVF|nr:NmrA-domain-containing protein [Hyaloscypha variabilis F]
MPSATPRSALTIRPRPSPTHEPPPQRRLKHRPCTSYTDLESQNVNLSVQHPQNSYNDRPAKRSMPTPNKTIAVVNSSGRQAASFIRVAVAVGYHVRAQLRNLDGIVASEIESLPNVTVLVGDLYIRSSPSGTGSPTKAGVNHALIEELYKGAQLAFINTTFWGDEVAIGCALADAAVKAGIEHYIYSSMPNHSLHNPTWPSLPLWSSKFTIEQYIRTLPSLLPKTTFLYTGIYNNNFTSLPYPLFCTALQPSGSFTWTAPFHPDVPLPWLDAEHDVGPAVLQIFKDGLKKWGNGTRIPLAYELLSPREACRAFSRGVGRPVSYIRSPSIAVSVKIPNGYREQLVALEEMYALSAEDPSLQPPYFADEELERDVGREDSVAMGLWEGFRGLEEYAREVFPLEEAANGLTWMNEEEEEGEEGVVQGGEEEGDDEDEEDDDDGDEGLVIGGGVGAGDTTPARKEESWLA